MPIYGHHSKVHMSYLSMLYAHGTVFLLCVCWCSYTVLYTWVEYVPVWSRDLIQIFQYSLLENLTDDTIA